MKIVDLDGYAANPGDVSWEEIRSLGELTVYDRSTPEEVVDRAQGAEVILTNKVIVGEKEMAQLPDLRYIVAGAGSLGFRKNQWALCDEEMMKDTTKIVFNTEPMIVRGKSESDLIDIYSVYMDYQIGFSDARPIIFSNNA